MGNREGFKLQEAKQKVQRLKSFYNHVAVFILVAGSLFLFKDKMTVAIFGKEALGDPRFMHWIDINAYIWFGILVIHAIVVFGGLHNFVKRWEERQIERYIQEKETKKYE